MNKLHLSYSYKTYEFSPVENLKKYTLYVDRVHNMCAGLETVYTEHSAIQENGTRFTTEYKFFLKPLGKYLVQYFFWEMDIEKTKNQCTYPYRMEKYLVDYTIEEVEFVFDNLLTDKRWVNLDFTDSDIAFREVIINPNSNALKFLNKNGEFESAYAVENPIILDHNTLLIKAYGKYEPDVTILVPENEVYNWSTPNVDFNLGAKELEVIRGNFFLSKKGNRVFRIDKNGTHYLLRDGWGGPFNTYRGRVIPKDSVLYYKRAHSNKGNAGYDYAIVPVDWKNIIEL